MLASLLRPSGLRDLCALLCGSPFLRIVGTFLHTSSQRSRKRARPQRGLRPTLRLSFTKIFADLRILGERAPRGRAFLFVEALPRG